MRGYGQFCPIAKASEVLGERWTNLIIREMAAGSDSFNDLRKGLPLISPSLLSARLKSLESAGIVERIRLQSGHTRYLLTLAGEELVPIIWQLGSWGHKWVRSSLSKDDLDPSLLVWDIHRTLKTDFFPPDQRKVIQIEFTDYTSRMRFWWLVVKDGEVDVCLKDPGHEVDLVISTDLRTLTAVWMGDSTMSRELRTKRIILSGSSELKKNINHWLGTNSYATVQTAR